MKLFGWLTPRQEAPTTPQKPTLVSEYVALSNGKGGYITQFARELNLLAATFSVHGTQLEARYNVINHVAEIYDVKRQRVVVSATARGQGPFAEQIEIMILYNHEGMRQFLEEVLPPKIRAVYR